MFRSFFFIKTIVILIACIAYSPLRGFDLLNKNQSTHLSIHSSEHTVVFEAVKMFSIDLQRVGGMPPMMDGLAGNGSILIGTYGKNPDIQRLIHSGAITADSIISQWEAFQIQVVSDGADEVLVVLGSDSRGTAYGVLELSRLLGVSPWVWWADSAPKELQELILPSDYFDIQKPDVQYRGIFINDEDLGFCPWSTKTLEKTAVKGATGPKAYERVFQLMLRLRANTLWPAMHRCTVPFYQVEGNQQMSDKYAIVIGTSHHEPLMCNTEEWDAKALGEFNFATNAANIKKFWADRLSDVGSSENFYTMGIRGAGDVGMEGARTLDEKTGLMNEVLSSQRDLIGEYVNALVEKVPQVFVPYKEVLPIYENGLNVPEDVTLMWCDDNYGYMTRQSSPTEQDRAGGTGIYYHLSYLGRPHQYIWLSTTSLPLIYWQLKKSWDHGARKIWIFNVGDIKPAELELEFALDMAWDIERVDHASIEQWQKHWFEREFGKEHAAELSEIKNEYYRLAHIRRPEFMGWSRQEEAGYPRGGRTPVTNTAFDPYLFGDQIANRIGDYEAFSAKIHELERTIPAKQLDAFFQLVTFPVLAATEMNKKLLYAQKARIYAQFDLPVTNEYIARSEAAFDSVESLVRYYNRDVAEGKWNKMMTRRYWGAPVYERAPLPDSIPVGADHDVLIWAEGTNQPAEGQNTIQLMPFISGTKDQTFISVFSKSEGLTWKIRKRPDWLLVRERPTGLIHETRVEFSINPKTKVKKDNSGVCHLTINGKAFQFEVNVSGPDKISCPTEYDSLVIFEIDRFETEGKGPTQYTGLGYSMKALELEPGKQASLTYQFHTKSVGEAILRVGMLPNHPINSEDIRYAISVDGSEPVFVSILSDFNNRDETWKENVLRNLSVTKTAHYFAQPGLHTLEIYALDEGLVLDQLSVDFVPRREIYDMPNKR